MSLMGHGRPRCHKALLKTFPMHIFWELSNQPFHDGGPYHIKTSPLFCYANQWAGFYNSLKKSMEVHFDRSKIFIFIFTTHVTSIYEKKFDRSTTYSCRTNGYF